MGTLWVPSGLRYRFLRRLSMDYRFTLRPLAKAPRRLS